MASEQTAHIDTLRSLLTMSRLPETLQLDDLGSRIRETSDLMAELDTYPEHETVLELI